MPTALIEIRKQYTEQEEVAIVKAVHSAMTAALQLPEWDGEVRLVVHAPHRFACPPNKGTPERYTLIGIDLFSGRSIEAKRALYSKIVDNLAACGIPGDHITINLNEIARENWGIRGGKPASEVELGFKVDV